MNERIKQLRKALGLSQDEFGKKLGVTRGAVTNIELNKTEPKPLFVNLICEVFNVNPLWIKNGEGEMFIDFPELDELGIYTEELLTDTDDEVYMAIKAFMKVYGRLDKASKKVAKQIAKDLVEELKKEQD